MPFADETRRSVVCAVAKETSQTQRKLVWHSRTNNNRQIAREEGPRVTENCSGKVMDHGPSELQLSLLMLAAQKRQAKVPVADAGMRSADLTLTEALTGLYGWKPHAGDPRDSGRQFRPEEIGVKRYNCVRGTVSKAFKRLELRGYVKRYGGVGQKWSGIVLTNAGLAVAKAMLEAGEAPKTQKARKKKRR